MQWLLVVSTEGSKNIEIGSVYVLKITGIYIAMIGIQCKIYLTIKQLPIFRIFVCAIIRSP